MKCFALLTASLVAAFSLSGQFRPKHRQLPTTAKGPTEGTLYRLNDRGEPVDICPLKHTDVKARISGYLARVNVTQEFVNSGKDKIEAVYKFPLPPMAAVDDMRMVVGDRTVIGKIKPKEEAQAIYAAARAAGQVASLLDQERPNIFTQSVTNIAPGATVKIVISYVETVPYEDGSYAFTFPMVVGPRYIPEGMADAGSVVSRRTPEGTRAGHDLSLEVAVDAGVAVSEFASPTHAIDVAKGDAHHATAKLRDAATIPNKDFILRYRVAGQKIDDAVLTHNGLKGGYFTLILQPPARVPANEITPKEIVFVIDTSGSMMGFPIEKAKEAMKLAMDTLNPRDTFNLITFSGDEHILFPKPVPATPENVRKAQEFLLSRSGSGGTEMMKAIRASLDPSDQQDHIRIACFMTDGEVGNDMEIIGEVQKHPNARVFAFGIGSSTNHFLLDNMAKYGRGEVEYVGLNDDGDAAARRFHERVHSPVLTDISIDRGGLPVSDVYPKRIPDLFSAKPVVLTGRFNGSGKGSIKLRGKIAGKEFERVIAVNLPASDPNNDVLATVWARAKVEDLMSQDWLGVQRNTPRANLKDAILELGLNYRLMTQYTSFVAVEETTIMEGGKPRRIEVPVEMPEGVSYEGIYGRGDASPKMMVAPMPAVARAGGFVRPYPSTMATQAPPPPNRMMRESHDSMQPPVKISPKLAAIKTGNISVQIWLSDTSPQMMAKLKALGVEVLVQPNGKKLIIARLAAEKLQALAAMTEVKYIAPVS